MTDAPLSPGRPAKYPWGKLAVGETATVTDVPSRNAMYASMHQWRDSIIRQGLGYTREHAPQFSCPWDVNTGIATITRLPDGPIVHGHRSLVQRQKTQEQREREARIKFLLDWEEAYQNAVYAADMQDRPRPMVPLDIIERAKADLPWMAQRLADLNCRARPTKASRTAALEKAHNAEPDTPADRHFARKLIQAANKIRSESDKPA